MKMPRLFLAASLIALTSLSAPVFADNIYTYTGNAFTYFGGSDQCPSFCSVTGSFTVAAPLTADMPLTAITPESFSFTDGSNIITQANVGVGNSFIEVGTDASGAIVSWNVILTEGWPPNIVTQNYLDADPSSPAYGSMIQDDETVQDEFIDGYAFNQNPGTWTETDPTSTPEPSSLLMLSGGLVGLGFIKRKLFQS